MNKIGKIDFKTIKWITPSQFHSMKNCAYKSLLAEAFEKKPLLPVSSNAYFGTVLHKMLELITRGLIKNQEDFNRAFDEHLKTVEDDLQKNGYSFFIPLQKNVKDFGLKKVLLKKHLRITLEEPTKSDNKKFYSEKWFQTKDKVVAGKIDLTIESENDVEIIDFKTGAITESILDDNGEVFSDVKEEYKEQLKLYAYLYFENTGKFPIALSLVDLKKQKFVVTYSRSESIAIFEEAKKLLNETNECVSKRSFTANPTEANCKYCLYRPACSFFQKQLESDSSFNDVSGFVRNVTKYQNGNVNVFLESGGRKFTITGFLSEKYDELNGSRNKRIGIYNLMKEATEFVYSVTKTTIIYEQ